MSRNLDAKGTVLAADLYERDFYSWTQEQAGLLRAGRLNALDVTNILEEIETLGRSERAALKSAYRLICSHLLKMMYQPQRSSRSWYNTVDRARNEVVDILAENPGLRQSRDDAFAKAYALGRKDAARETRLSLDSFPKARRSRSPNAKAPSSCLVRCVTTSSSRPCQPARPERERVERRLLTALRFDWSDGFDD